jgi:hypothetical protein
MSVTSGESSTPNAADRPNRAVKGSLNSCLWKFPLCTEISVTERGGGGKHTPRHVDSPGLTEHTLAIARFAIAPQGKRDAFHEEVWIGKVKAVIECCIHVATTSSYSGGPGFKSWVRHRAS